MRARGCPILLSPHDYTRTCSHSSGAVTHEVAGYGVAWATIVEAQKNRQVRGVAYRRTVAEQQRPTIEAVEYRGGQHTATLADSRTSVSRVDFGANLEPNLGPGMKRDSPPALRRCKQVSVEP